MGLDTVYAGDMQEHRAAATTCRCTCPLDDGDINGQLIFALKCVWVAGLATPAPALKRQDVKRCPRGSRLHQTDKEEQISDEAGTSRVKQGG